MAHPETGFLVTILKPSTTYGRKRVVRQAGIDTRWVRRIAEGRPILRVGGGTPGVFAKNLIYTAAKLQRDVPAFVPAVSLHDGLADSFAYLEEHGLIEEVPRDDWEDQIIGIQRDARARILKVDT